MILSKHSLLQKVPTARLFFLKLIVFMIFFLSFIFYFCSLNSKVLIVDKVTVIYLFSTVIELVGPVPRIYVANWSLIAWCFGLFLFTLLVYCERNWFYLMLWLAIPTIPPLVLWMWELLPSSFFCIVIHKQMHRQLGVFFTMMQDYIWQQNVSMHNFT